MMSGQQPETKISSFTFPSPGVLLVTLTRAKELNTIPRDGHWELDRVWTWMDSNPEISVGIFTGSGRAFCTGADLRGLSGFPCHLQVQVNILRSLQSGPRRPRIQRDSF